MIDVLAHGMRLVIVAFLVMGCSSPCAPLRGRYLVAVCAIESLETCSDANWASVTPYLEPFPFNTVLVELPEDAPVPELPLVEVFDETGSSRLDVVPEYLPGRSFRYGGCTGSLLRFDLRSRLEARVLVVHWIDNAPPGLEPSFDPARVETFRGARALTTLLELRAIADAGGPDAP